VSQSCFNCVQVLGIYNIVQERFFSFSYSFALFQSGLHPKKITCHQLEDEVEKSFGVDLSLDCIVKPLNGSFYPQMFIQTLLDLSKFMFLLVYKSIYHHSTDQTHLKTNIEQNKKEKLSMDYIICRFFKIQLLSIGEEADSCSSQNNALFCCKMRLCSVHH
jgi:hypothetical protein